LWTDTDKINFKKDFLSKEKSKVDTVLQIMLKKFITNSFWKITLLQKFIQINAHRSLEVFLAMHLELKIMSNNRKTKIWKFIFYYFKKALHNNFIKVSVKCTLKELY
jgi:hypothetical protein